MSLSAWPSRGAISRAARSMGGRHSTGEFPGRPQGRREMPWPHGRRTIGPRARADQRDGSPPAGLCRSVAVPAAPRLK
eukprot:2815108-Alexandrium_andersonii.AAC.1